MCDQSCGSDSTQCVNIVSDLSMIGLHLAEKRDLLILDFLPLFWGGRPVVGSRPTDNGVRRSNVVGCQELFQNPRPHSFSSVLLARSDDIHKVR